MRSERPHTLITVSGLPGRTGNCAPLLRVGYNTLPAGQKAMLRSFLLRVMLWPIWITITAAAAMGLARSVGRAAATPVTGRVRRDSPVPKLRSTASWGPVVALTLLALFLVGDVLLTLTWEDFAYLDNSMFTLFALKGHHIAAPVWGQSGRFFPLGHQEFNLIRHFTSTVAGYQALPIIQLLVLSGILLILDEELSMAARAGLTALALVSPAIASSFGGLIYPERNVVVWLACLALSVKRFEQTQATAWAVFAVICAQFMIYYKETAFLLLLGLAAGRLVLRCKSTVPVGRWNYERFWDKDSRLDLYLASLGILFVLAYLGAMVPHLHMQYARDYRLPLAEVVVAYLNVDLLAWLFVALVLGRVYLMTRRRLAPSLFWDGLALGGVACFAGYLCLGMFSAYYLAPVDLIAVLYVGRFAVMSWQRRRLWSKVLIMMIFGAVLLQDVALSAFRVYERKNSIHAKAEIARVVKSECRNGGAGNVRRIFFPFASPYSVMEFASYLSYRGVAVEGIPVESAGFSTAVMAGKAVTKDGPCVDYIRRVTCHAASGPEPGDLVIILPDDDASLAEAAPYRDRGELLFSYEPHPRIPQLLRPFVKHLDIASYAFARRDLPDGWLCAAVILW